MKLSVYKQITGTGFITIENDTVKIDEKYLENEIWNYIECNDYAKVDIDKPVNTNLETDDPVCLVIEGEVKYMELFIKEACITTSEKNYFFYVPQAVIYSINRQLFQASKEGRF